MLPLEDIEEAQAALGGLANETPTHRWRFPLIQARLRGVQRSAGRTRLGAVACAVRGNAGVACRGKFRRHRAAVARGHLTRCSPSRVYAVRWRESSPALGSWPDRPVECDSRRSSPVPTRGRDARIPPGFPSEQRSPRCHARLGRALLRAAAGPAYADSGNGRTLRSSCGW